MNNNRENSLHKYHEVRKECKSLGLQPCYGAGMTLPILIAKVSEEKNRRSHSRTSTSPRKDRTGDRSNSPIFPSIAVNNRQSESFSNDNTFSGGSSVGSNDSSRGSNRTSSTITSRAKDNVNRRPIRGYRVLVLENGAALIDEFIVDRSEAYNAAIDYFIDELGEDVEPYEILRTLTRGDRILSIATNGQYAVEVIPVL